MIKRKGGQGKTKEEALSRIYDSYSPFIYVPKVLRGLRIKLVEVNKNGTISK